MANGKEELRQRAIAAHQRAWTLLDQPTRTESENDEMIAAADASLADWLAAGGPVEAQRGHWLVARVAVAANRPALALDHAKRAMTLTQQHHAILRDFDLAFAHEIMARALALAGEADAARAHYAIALQMGDAIANGGDRAEFFRQFAIGPWLGADG